VSRKADELAELQEGHVDAAALCRRLGITRVWRHEWVGWFVDDGRDLRLLDMRAAVALSAGGCDGSLANLANKKTRALLEPDHRDRVPSASAVGRLELAHQG
jgi:hypothetical protein